MRWLVLIKKALSYKKVDPRKLSYSRATYINFANAISLSAQCCCDCRNDGSLQQLTCFMGMTALVPCARAKRSSIASPYAIHNAAAKAHPDTLPTAEIFVLN